MKVKDINDKFEINQLVAEVLAEVPLKFTKWFRNSQVKKSVGKTSLKNHVAKELERQLFDSLKTFEGYKDFSNDDIIEIIKKVINKINNANPNIVSGTKNVKPIIELQISDIIKREIEVKKNYFKNITDTKNKEKAEFKNLLSDVNKMIDDYERPKKQTLLSRISQVFRSRSAIEAQKENEKRIIESLKETISQITNPPSPNEKFQRKGYTDLIPKSSSKKEILLAALEKTLIKTKDNELSTDLSYPISNILKKFTTGSMARILKRREDYEQFKKDINEEKIETERLLKDTEASHKHLKQLAKENKTVKRDLRYNKEESSNVSKTIKRAESEGLKPTLYRDSLNALESQRAYLTKVNIQAKKPPKIPNTKATTRKKVYFVNINKTRKDDRDEDKKAVTQSSTQKTEKYGQYNIYWRDPFSNEEHKKISEQAKKSKDKKEEPKSILKKRY